MKNGCPLASLLFSIALNAVVDSSVSKGKNFKCIRVGKEKHGIIQRCHNCVVAKYEIIYRGLQKRVSLAKLLDARSVCKNLLDFDRSVMHKLLTEKNTKRN